MRRDWGYSSNHTLYEHHMTHTSALIDVYPCLYVCVKYSPESLTSEQIMIRINNIDEVRDLSLESI